MIKKFTLLLWLAIPLLSMAQPLPVAYEYDASGNRTARKIVTMSPPQCSPPAPQDSSFTANPNVETDNSGCVKIPIQFIKQKVLNL